MKICHVCGTSCENEAEICSKCGAELPSFEEYEAERQLKETTEKTVIKTPVLAVSVDNVVTAEIFKDILVENEIAFSCDENEDGMHIGFGGSFFAVDIYVDERNLERAKELYREVLESEPMFDDDFDGFFEDTEETEV